MIGPVEHFVFILFAWLLSAITRHRFVPLILGFLGFSLLFAYTPGSAVFVLGVSFQAIIYVFFLKKRDRSNSWRKYFPYTILLNLFFVDFHSLIIDLSIPTIGVSFSIIRIFMTCRELLAERKAFVPSNYIWIVVSAFYLPALIVGPVFSGTLIRDQTSKPKNIIISMRDHRMILQGLVLSLLLAAWLSDIGKDIRKTPELTDGIFQISDTYMMAYLSIIMFIQLFSAFWGQSLIAEHSSKFFGVDLPKNFDRPWKAKTIKEFWSRWHRSMATFVIKYIFLPLNLKGVPPKFATILAFLFMGLWHNVSWGYFIWGCAHGVLMAYWPSDKNSVLNKKMGIIVTWFIVIFLSYLANYSELAQ
jgi:D-alanyl-lipoteichoic acid acyltransferase DltB (MBOAT superfamily)